MTRVVLELHVCPSNGTIIRRHKERYGEMPIVSHFHQKLPRCGNNAYTRSTKTQPTEAWEGWGDDVSHYYVVEDMLKLHPGQLMGLYDFVVDGKGKRDMMDWMALESRKAAVEAFIAGLGEWFDNNGETLGETVRFVTGERGEEEVGSWGDIVFEGGS